MEVIVIKNHPLWNNKIDSDIQKILVTSDAIYRLLVEKLNFDSAEAVRIRNDWIDQRTKKKGDS